MGGERDISLDPTGGGLFLFIALGCGVFARVVLSATGLPYTVILLLLGCLFGALDGTFGIPLGAFSDSLTTWANLDPHMILYIFLPGLIFGSAFAFDFHIFKKEMWQMMLLAGPGVVVSSVLLALFAMYVFPYNWGWFTALTFGSMMSATDPVAVVALLRELGASKRLSLLIEGESLLNDGTAMVVFVVFKNALVQGHLEAGEALATFAELSIGGPILGILVGMITLWILKRIHFDSTSDITITLVACYGIFILAEGLMPFQVSGILAVVSLGLMLSSSGRAVVADHHHVHQFWEIIEYFANTIIFILAGVVIVEQGFTDRITVWDWVYLLLLYVAIHIVRALAVLMLSPLLARLGYGVTWKEMVVLTYSGLRGAVGLALALLLQIDHKITEQHPDVGNLFVFHMAGIAALTLLVNASTTGLLVEKLGVANVSVASKQIFHNAYLHIKHTYEDKIQEMKKDDFYSDADWEHVSMWMGKLSEGIGDEQARHDPSHVVRGLQSMFRAASQALVRHSDPVRPTSLRGIEEHDMEEDSEDEDDVVVVEAEDGEQFHACASHALLDTSGLNEPATTSSRRLKPTISRVMNRGELRQWGVGGPSYRSSRSRQSGGTAERGGGGLGVLAEHDEYEEDEKAAPGGRLKRHLSMGEKAQNVFVRDRLQRQSSSDDDHGAGTGAAAPHVNTAPTVAGVHSRGDSSGSGRSPGNVRSPGSGRHGVRSPNGRRGSGPPTAARSQFQAAGQDATLSTSFVDTHPYDDEVDNFLGSVCVDSHRTLDTQGPTVSAKRFISREEVSFVQLLAEARHRYLNLVKSKIWEEFGHGYLTKTGVSMLMNAASFSQDKPNDPLAEWKFLSEDLQLNACTQSLLRHKHCTGLGMRLLFTPLMNQFDVATSFIRVHKAVQDPFQELIVGHTHSESARRIALQVSQLIFQESDAMVEDARQVVSSIETYIPKTVRAIKTEQVIHALLKDAKNTAKMLLHHGELEEKEYTIIDEALSHLHKKVRVPKQLQIPSLMERLRTYGLLKGMSEDMCAKVEAARLPKWYPKDKLIFKQGDVATGVYIIFGGKVSVVRRHTGQDTFTESARAAAGPAVAPDGYQHERAPMMRGAYFKSVATMVVDKTPDGEEVVEEVLMTNLPRGSVVGLLSMLTGQPMLTSIRCDSLVDGVWFDEWTIGKLLKSKHENKDDPVKVPSVLQQNLCQMAARTIAQMYIPRLRRLGSERLAAMLDSAVLVRPVAGAGLLIKGHSILLTGALMTPTDWAGHRAAAAHATASTRAMGGVPAVPTQRFLATGMHSQHSVNSAVVSTRSVDGVQEAAMQTGAWTATQVAVSFLQMSEEFRHFSKGTRLLVFPPGATREIGFDAKAVAQIVKHASKWINRSRRGSTGSQFASLRSRSKLFMQMKALSPSHRQRVQAAAAARRGAPPMLASRVGDSTRLGDSIRLNESAIAGGSGHLDRQDSVGSAGSDVAPTRPSGATTAPGHATPIPSPQSQRAGTPGTGLDSSEDEVVFQSSTVGMAQPKAPPQQINAPRQSTRIRELGQLDGPKALNGDAAAGTLAGRLGGLTPSPDTGARTSPRPLMGSHRPVLSPIGSNARGFLNQGSDAGFVIDEGDDDDVSP